MLAVQYNSFSLTNAKTDTEVLGFWLSDKAKTTQKTYNYSLRQFFEFCPVPLGEIKLDNLIDFKEYLQGFNYAVATVNNKLMAIKSLLSYAHKIGYIMFNVGAVVKTMKNREGINEKILSANEIKALIECAKNTRDKLVIKTLANTGLRISELINLKWTDINNGKITVFGKGNKTRFIPIRKELEEELSQLKSKYTDLIFHSNKFTSLKRENVHTMLKATAKKANLTEKVSCHWLRHSTASHTLNNGATLNQVQELLGHGSINTTARYLHTINGSHAIDYVNF